MSMHIPDENEEWMQVFFTLILLYLNKYTNHNDQLELAKLTQFTRIFPPGDPRFPSTDKVTGEEDIEEDVVEEDNDNEENNNNNNNSNEIEINKNNHTESSKTAKPIEAVIKGATVEEILFQVIFI